MSSFFYFNSFPQGLSLFLPLLVPDVWLVGYASVSVGFFTGRSSQRLSHDSQTPVLLVKNWQRRRGRGETHSVANVQQDACANVYINQVATPPPFFHAWDNERIFLTRGKDAMLSRDSMVKLPLQHSVRWLSLVVLLLCVAEFSSSERE